MTLVRFYYLLRVLFNTTLVVEFDDDWTWLLTNGYIQASGSASYQLTNTGNAFVMGRFQKILDLP